MIAPQLRQALKVLQVGALELRSTILEELQTNPALEEMASGDTSLDGMVAPGSTSETHENGEMREMGEASGKTKEAKTEKSGEESAASADDDWEDNYGPPPQPYNKEAADKRQFFFDSLTEEASMQQKLMGQAKLTDADEKTLNALEFLIGNLDDRGFLTVEPAAVAEQSKEPIAVVLKALRLLKSLEPQGLGSRDLQECLLTQLELQGIKGNADSLAEKILSNHFALFLRRRIPELARALEVDTTEIEEALKVIAELDPAPGRNFAEDTNRVIVPDVRIYKEDEKWQLEMTRDYLPRLRLSANFKQYLADKRLSGSEKEFLQEKLKAGRQLITAIEQRQQTIERIARLLLEIQLGFFEHGLEKLKPLTMAQIAEKIGVHETTISRAIANKYISTPHGIFPFKFFFTPGYTNSSGETVSNKSIKDKIATLIADEEGSKPLSDQAIAEILKKDNINIARRTVAKYREELNILPTHLRRQFKD
jgi:RNA polymerase sigma-54 factor